MTIEGTRVGIYGGSGFGKSVRIKAIIRKARRCIVFDPEEEYEAEGFKQFTDLKKLCRYVTENFKAFRVCYVPRGGTHQEALHLLSEFIFSIQGGFKKGAHKALLHFVIEEMNTSYPTNIKDKYSGFMDICSRGRKRGICVYGVAQRPSEVNTNFRGNLQHTFVFNLPDHVDTAVFGKTFGPSYINKIKSLGVHEYYYRNPQGIVQKGKNAITW